MRTFTATEIDLCKKIAEKERKFIRLGDWVLHDLEKPGLVGYLKKQWIDSISKEEIRNIIPLWQEHDCLEWLNKLGFMHFLAYGESNQCLIRKGRWGEYVVDTSGKTFLEALLRAVLAVMDGKC